VLAQALRSLVLEIALQIARFKEQILIEVRI
jgi:hypothetical protein